MCTLYVGGEGGLCQLGESLHIIFMHKSKYTFCAVFVLEVGVLKPCPL